MELNKKYISIIEYIQYFVILKFLIRFQDFSESFVTHMTPLDNIALGAL